jgi:hypothetical protein
VTFENIFSTTAIETKQAFPKFWPVYFLPAGQGGIPFYFSFSFSICFLTTSFSIIVLFNRNGWLQPTDL